MYTILIVDDERIEREGILKLLGRQGFALKPVTAENGEVALDVLKSQSVDILMTDIKMPFMDGLELAEKASELNPDLEVIIYSAFSDFEYAKRALKTNASQYILKPINIAEFRKVLETTIASCEERKREREEWQRVMEGYRKGMQYEKEKGLLDALYGTKQGGDWGTDDRGGWIQLALIDFSSRFFDADPTRFREMLLTITEWAFDFLNVNERQSVLFLRQDEPCDRQELRLWGERLLGEIAGRFGLPASVIFGEPVQEWASLKSIYHEMELKLGDVKFFLEGSAVLFADEQETPSSLPPGLEVERLLEKIEQCLAYRDAQGAVTGIELLFAHLQAARSASVLYTKFIVTNIMQKIVADLKRLGKPMPGAWFEPLFRTDSIQELKSILLAAVQQLAPEPEAADAAGRGIGKVVRQVVSVIENEYMRDLSLEYIAEKVYLTPSYLSYLFKKETGTSLVRYLTSYRLDKATDLLANTTMKIAEIGERLGYANPSYFIQTFKNHYGVSPAKFRESQP
ncbi:response regulator transcription factor [Cohnella zeiphila]|uniref:Response regulator n=1 Tax=Cohnella zeiphila TaxID=2761120 RepID=A0A7X0STB9_9BACL|nr:response regulator [Cohnella zeiphila]MBB6734774.1 response regulator [Cohnella zeiphila]